VPKILSAADVAQALNVSRETSERLELYVELLLKCQRAINLIGAGTIDDIWRRHILDCGQLWRYLPKRHAPLVDIGTGAGLPGLVLALLGAEDVHLVEADSRKCQFLREAARLTGTPVEIHNARSETLQELPARVVTARAVAPMGKLLNYAEPLIRPDTICFFFKGKGVNKELTDIKNNWIMEIENLPSVTESAGGIVRLEAVARVDKYNS